ncbi:MAG: lipopolysaccharide biosynthesis protein [Kiloniellaceae bacterium]
MANFGGRTVAVALSIGAIPLYIRFLGIEAYGVVGIFVTLTALSAIFDAGLGPTATRELARLTTSDEGARDARNLTRTLETIYWIAALGVGATAMLLAETIARHWLQIESLSVEEVSRALRLMGVVLAFQFPAAFYSACLIGLQRQVLLNAVSATGGSLQVLGALAVLWLISPSLEAFYFWFAVSRAAQTGLLAILVWRRLPPAAGRARFDMGQFRRVWRFAAGMGGTAIVGLVLMQVDSLVVSRLLPLSQYGYYMVARTVAQGIFLFVAPVFTAVFPHFSQLVAGAETAHLRGAYHRASQFLSVAIMPATVVLVLFAHEALWAWTGDVEITRNAALLVGILSIGVALNGVQHAPYSLQLAYGWVRFLFASSVLAMAFLVPATIYLTTAYGAQGAASAWLAMNLAVLAVVPPLLHRRILPGALGRWYLVDVARPLLAAALVAGAARWLIPPMEGRALSGLVVVAVFALAALAALATAPWIRIELTQIAGRFLAGQAPRGHGASALRWRLLQRPNMHH